MVNRQKFEEISS